MTQDRRGRYVHCDDRSRDDRPEALAFVDRLGQRQEFERMIDRAKQIVPGLASIEVALDEATDEMPPGVILWTHRDDLTTDDDPTQQGGSSGWRRHSRRRSARTSFCCRFIAPMEGRALLDVGRELATGLTEARWRSSVGRAYFALLHEVLGRAGAGASHCLLATRCTHSPGSNSFMRPIPTSNGSGWPSRPLDGFATRPTTNFGTSGPFVSPRIAATALTDAEGAIAVLDAIESDPARRASAARTIPP